MADYTPAQINYRQMPGQMDAHAGAQQSASKLFRDTGRQQSEEYLSTMLPLDSRPDLPPNMRNHTRWAYVEEYMGYWKYEQICRLMGIALLVLGFVTLNVFLPGALLMLAVSARLLDLSWWYGFIAHKFGNFRSLVLID